MMSATMRPFWLSWQVDQPDALSDRCVLGLVVSETLGDLNRTPIGWAVVDELGMAFELDIEEGLGAGHFCCPILIEHC